MLTQRQIKIILIGVVILGIFIAILALNPKPNPKSHLTLTVWGLDAPDVWNDLLSPAYTQQTVGNVINYRQMNAATYEQDLIDALASGSGPDVFYIADTWPQKHWAKIKPAPAEVFDATTLKEQLVKLPVNSFIDGTRVNAMPLFVDTLALFYNQSLFDQGAIAYPPKTWEELQSMVPKLTKLNSQGGISYAGVALGSGSNIANAADILSLMMMQFGSPIASERTAKLNDQAAQALSFYVQFAKLGNKTYSWDPSLDPSLETFAKGRAAIAFGYASDISAIRKTAPYFTFKIAPMLQLKSSELRTDFGRSWGLTVSKQSWQSTAAWELIKIVTNANLAESYSLRTGLPPAQKSVLNGLLNHITLGTFNRQAFTAINWPKPNNAAVDTLFSGAIDDVLANRQSSSGAIGSLNSQLNRLFDALP